MSPEENKKELKEKFKKKRELKKNKEFKSFSELNIDIDKEVIEEWRKNR